jgi:hypothetical protein
VRGLIAGTSSKSRFVKLWDTWADTALQESLVVHLAVGRRGEYSDRFEEVALSGAVGANEHVDNSQFQLDRLERLERFDFDCFDPLWLARCYPCAMVSSRPDPSGLVRHDPFPEKR